MQFDKQYLGAHLVRYRASVRRSRRGEWEVPGAASGEISGDGEERVDRYTVEGRWWIEGNWNGLFVMYLHVTDFPSSSEGEVTQSGVKVADVVDHALPPLPSPLLSPCLPHPPRPQLLAELGREEEEEEEEERQTKENYFVFPFHLTKSLWLDKSFRPSPLPPPPSCTPPTASHNSASHSHAPPKGDSGLRSAVTGPAPYSPTRAFTVSLNEPSMTKASFRHRLMVKLSILSLFLSFCLSVCLSVCMSGCLSVWLSVWFVGLLKSYFSLPFSLHFSLPPPSFPEISGYGHF